MEKLNDKVKENNDKLKLPSAIQSLLKDESMSDVELLGNDGVRIQAHRLILSSRSAIFKKMLFGSFSEANSPLVKVDYSGKILHFLIEYCYTDKFSPPTMDTDDDTTLIHFLIELVHASDYYELPGLCRQVKKSLIENLSQKPSMAWQVLTDYPNLLDGIDDDEVLDIVQKFLTTEPRYWQILSTLPDQALDGKLGKVALNIVRQISHVTMVPSTLSAKFIEMIFSDGAILGQEIDFFRLIERWVGSSNKKDDNNDDIGPSKAKRAKVIQSMDDKLSVATSLIDKYIKLDRIKPSDLEGIVEPSVLVSKEAVLDAYRKQARALERRNDKYFTPTRGVYWESSTGSIYECTPSLTERRRSRTERRFTELLRCNELRGPGVYKWSLQILGGTYFECGVVEAAAVPEVDRNEYLSDQKLSGWVYSNGGYTCFGGNVYYLNHGEPTYPPKFGGDTGSMVIELTLDLTGNGSLTARFNERQNPILLFKDMMAEGRAFVPAVSMKAPGKVEFLGFDNE